MKKGLLLVVVMLATIAVKAQDIYVGGSLNVWRNSTGNTTSFKVAPEVGYNFNETWALGAELGLRPGIAVKLNDHFSFIAKYGFLGYRRNINTLGDSFGLELTSEDLSIGFHYAF